MKLCNLLELLKNPIPLDWSLVSRHFNGSLSLPEFLHNWTIVFFSQDKKYCCVEGTFFIPTTQSPLLIDTVCCCRAASVLHVKV